jgi:hypothetical protein
MKTTDPRLRCKYLTRFTLIEMLVYVSVFGTMTSYFLGYFHSVVMLNRQAVVRATRYQATKLLQKQWGDGVAGCGSQQWSLTEGVLNCETAQIKLEGRRIAFHFQGERKRALVLPETATPSFSVETEDTITRLVLTLSFQRSNGFRSETIRLIGIPSQSTGER